MAIFRYLWIKLSSGDLHKNNICSFWVKLIWRAVCFRGAISLKSRARKQKQGGLFFSFFFFYPGSSFTGLWHMLLFENTGKVLSWDSRSSTWKHFGKTSHSCPPPTPHNPTTPTARGYSAGRMLGNARARSSAAHWHPAAECIADCKEISVREAGWWWWWWWCLRCLSAGLREYF